jgi:hypothetical protein
MEEKRKDLTASKQKQLINTIVARLSELHPSFYYSATSEIAYEIELYIGNGDGLSHDETEILKGLSRNDIQLILSLHSD